ncbi:MAG: hypothetical protein OXC79_13355 [Candidatus Poribacteria bacterium]|nr:hypothetical protein [Candidatus Poribacteria bacterium]
MKSITEMSQSEFRNFLGSLVNSEIFKSRDRLAGLLAKNSSRETLETEFLEFHGDYEDLAARLETYTEDPLNGLEPHATLTKKLKRQRDYILANRKTTLTERINRRMGVYLESDPKPEKQIIDLSQDEYYQLLRSLVTQELFAVREQLAALLAADASFKELDVAFREFFVAYELLELALEDYHYDPDEGLEITPEFAEELERVDASLESDGGTYSLEEVFKELEGE